MASKVYPFLLTALCNLDAARPQEPFTFLAAELQSLSAKG
eukprot:SAG31_NODE_23837_length_494_cov_1.430380_1_plen_39_part_01